jgi:hypothetical protein
VGSSISQTNGYAKGIYCFFAKQAELRETKEIYFA